MNIFEIVNYQVTFSPQALLIAPFREIWDLDQSEDKRVASDELAYVYFMCDDRSDHMYILDEQERHNVVVNSLENLDEDWIRPQYIERAMEYYKKYSETTSTRLLRSTRGIVERISGFLDTVDVNERDLKTNKPVFDINKIVTAVEKIPKLVKSINEIEQEVVKEKELKAQSGNRETGLFDDNGI